MTNTTQDDHDGGTELDSLRDALDAIDASNDAKRGDAPSGFDPAALFLLDLGFENLFNPASSGHQFICKGCGTTVKTWQRKKHHAGHVRARATLTSKGVTMKGKSATAGSKTAATAKLREEQAAKSEAEKGTTSTTEADEFDAAAPTATTAAKTPAKKPAAKKDTTPAVSDADVKKLTTELLKRVKTIKGSSTKANDTVGYIGIRVDGRTIGYAWKTKSGLRVEAAIEPADLTAKDRKNVEPCKRSSSIAAQTKLTPPDQGIDLAMKMLETAAAKVAAAEAKKAETKAARAAAKSSAAKKTDDVSVPEPVVEEVAATA